jgi:tetratricopeptide (TPR) repeat protein
MSPLLASSVALPLGRVELERGRLSDAAARAEAALEEEPGRAHQLLSSVALARGDLKQAESHARRAMADAAAELEAAMVLAQVHVQRSELPQALTVLEAAQARAASEKRVPPAGLGPLRADVLGRLGRFPEAQAVLEEELRLYPGRPQTYASLAVVLALQNRPRADVQRILEAMVKASPGRETILLAAKTLDFLGDKENAGAWRRRAASSGSRPR